MKSVVIIPIHGIGEVRAGDRLGMLIVSAADSAGAGLEVGDALVVTQKVVSKAEGHIVRISGEADRRRLVLDQSRRILRKRGEMVISETYHGFVCANAGVDSSNIEDGHVSLLPRNPDESAERIRAEIFDSCGVDVAVVISDTFGRTWRRGQTNVAIGVSGIAPLIDYRGTEDTFGKRLEATEIAIADEIASAAELVMGKATGVPAAVVRGLDPRWLGGRGSGRELLRPAREDLFR